MMRNILLIMMIVFALVSCDKDDDLGPSRVLIPEISESKLDQYISNNFTQPFNIEVKYKWDGNETELNKLLIPSKPNCAEFFLNIIEEAWINPYKRQAGDLFVKKHAPKLLVLVGGVNLNANGTTTGGAAESGKKIIMYEINSISREAIEQDPSQKNLIIAKAKHQIHIMHHEFAHILHQNKIYQPEWKKISPDYTSTGWINTTLEVAQNSGFITRYAKSEPNEDFVEMIATMLTHSSDAWNKKIENIASEKGRQIIRRKEKFIANYLKTEWNIDVFSLQGDISNQMDVIFK